MGAVEHGTAVAGTTDVVIYDNRHQAEFAFGGGAQIGVANTLGLSAALVNQCGVFVDQGAGGHLALVGHVERVLGLLLSGQQGVCIPVVVIHFFVVPLLVLLLVLVVAFWDTPFVLIVRHRSLADR